MALKDRWNRMVRKSISSSSSSAGTAESTNTTTTTPQTTKPTAAAPNPPAPADGSALSPQATTTSSAGGAPLAKSPTSRLAKTLTWRSGKSAEQKEQEKKAKKEKRQKAAGGKIIPHPSERPLTETNLRHQELLGAFSMNFGRRRASQGGGRTSFVSNVSPMGSRQASLDAGSGAVAAALRAPHGHGHGHGHSSLAREGVPPDVEEEGSQVSS